MNVSPRYDAITSGATLLGATLLGDDFVRGRLCQGGDIVRGDFVWVPICHGATFKSPGASRSGGEGATLLGTTSLIMNATFLFHFADLFGRRVASYHMHLSHIKLLFVAFKKRKKKKRKKKIIPDRLSKLSVFKYNLESIFDYHVY